MNPIGGSVAKTFIYLNTSAITNLSNQELTSLNLSNLKLAVFCGCETGKGGEGANNLPTVAVQRGAGTAIGFQESIDCRDANNWTRLLFYYMSSGHTVQSACDYMKNNISGWEDEATIDTVVVCGYKQARF